MIEEKKPISSIVADIVNALDHRLTIIQIKVLDDYDAYLLFETLNDRGLDLSVADLLKNYLFSKGETQIGIIQENWEEMVNSLGGGEVTRYLRHFWLSKEGVVREKDLYRVIADKFTTPRSVLNFSNQLRTSGELYGALTDIDSPWWDAFDPSEKKKIQARIGQLNLFRVSQCYPLLLASIEANDRLFPNLLDLVVVFTFRYSIILQSGTGNLERAFSDAARYIRDTPDASINDVFQRLESLYPTNTEFEEGFSKKEITSSALIRYVLSEVNNFLMKGRGLETIQDPRELNLEHILPKSLPEDWLSKFDGDHDLAKQFVNRIGNTTLLRAKLNTRVSNSNFGNKLKRAYTHDPLEITKPILEDSVWGIPQIDERQKWLASIASSVWGFNPGR